MKKSILIASAFAAGAVAFIYLMKKRKNRKHTSGHLALKHSHHLTDVFSKAKEHVMND